MPYGERPWPVWPPCGVRPRMSARRRSRVAPWGRKARLRQPAGGRCPVEDMRDLSKALSGLSWATPAGQLGSGSRQVFRAGAQLWRSALGSAFDSGGWMRAAFDLFERPAEGFRFFLPGREGGIARRELCNKAEVYLLVTGISELIGIPAAPPFPLAALVDRVFALGPFAALWGLEGLGLEYANAAWKDEPPHHSLNGESAAALQARSLPMLHAGMGIAFGQRLIAPLP